MRLPGPIMIVEDESLIAMVLQRMLTDDGWTICAKVSTGEEAVESVKTADPCLILMDIRLSGAMDGIEAAQQIQAFSNASIVFMTGYSDPAMRQRAEVLNPLGYLIKPVGMRDLEPLLEALRYRQ